LNESEDLETAQLIKVIFRLIMVVALLKLVLAKIIKVPVNLMPAKLRRINRNISNDLRPHDANTPRFQ
jgi:hypothetical protein